MYHYLAGCLSLDDDDDDDGTVSITSVGDYDPSTTSPTSCQNSCGLLGEMFALLMGGNTCLCANESVLYLPRGDNCNTSCTGQPDHPCGGVGQASVYGLMPTNINLSFGNSTYSVKLHENWSTTIDVSPSDLFETTEVVADFGDSTGAVTLTTPDLHHAYSLPGNYHVTVTAYGRGFVVRAETVVVVRVPDLTAELDCESQLDIGDNGTCIITANWAARLNVTAHLDPGYVNLAMSDAAFSTVGPVIPNDVNMTSISEEELGSQLGTFVVPASQFSVENSIIAWEFHARRTGTIELMVLSPECENSHRHGRSGDSDCDLPEEYGCSFTTDQLCPTCDPAGSMCNPAAEGAPGMSYRREATTTIEVTAVGRTVYNVEEDITVTPGDVIGFKLTLNDGQLSFMPSEYPEFRLHSRDDTVKDTVNVNPYVRAIMYNPTVARLQNSFTKRGLYNITTELKGDDSIQDDMLLWTVVTVAGDWTVEVEHVEVAAVNTPVTFHASVDVASKSAPVYSLLINGETYYNITNTSAMFIHSFSSIGTYEITVIVADDAGSTSNTSRLIVQEPVTNLSLSGDTDLPLNVAMGFNVTVDTGSDLRCLLHFGDGSTDTLGIHEVPLVHVSHSFNQPGSFEMNITCSNNISTANTTFLVNVFAPIELPSDQDPFTCAYANGDQVLTGWTFTVKSILACNASNIQGTVVTYIWDLGNGEHPIRTQEPHCNLTYSQAGIYTMTLTVENPLQTETWNNTLVLQEPIGNISILALNNVSYAGFVKYFEIHIDQLGTDPCLSVDMEEFFPVLMYGSPTCMDIGDRYIGNVSKLLQVNHTYWIYGDQTVSVRAWNLVSNVQESQTFEVLPDVCNNPVIRIRGGSTDRENPRSFVRNKAIVITADLEIKCYATSKNSMNWSAVQENPSTGEVVQVVDLSSFPSSHTAELLIPTNYLNPDLHRVTMCVELNPSVTDRIYRSCVFTYIVVTSAPLKALLFPGGTSRVVISADQSLDLNPNVLSLDLDESGASKSFTTFTWFCKPLQVVLQSRFPPMAVINLLKNFVLQQDKGIPVNLSSIIPVLLSLRDLSQIRSFIPTLSDPFDLLGSGCFNSNATEHGKLPSLDQGRLRVAGSMLVKDEPLVFAVVTWKGSRLDFAKLQVIVKDRAGPVMSISLAKSSHEPFQVTTVNTRGTKHRRLPSLDQGRFRIAGSMLVRKEPLVFAVVTWKGSRLDFAKLQVIVRDRAGPVMSISCVQKSQCIQQPSGQKINPSTRLVIKASCELGCGGSMRYRWTLKQEDSPGVYAEVPNVPGVIYGKYI
ncbi:uncharacterized protein LOC144922253 [Branchiostoma floridae x Branchiostoma belcheri]